MVDKETRRQALANYLDCDVNELEDGYSDEVFERDGEEYLVLDDKEADEAVVNDVEQLIDDMGLEAFSPMMQSWIVENAIYNDDWFEDALQEDKEYYVDNLDEDELIQELLDLGYLTEKDVHYDEDDTDEDYPIVNDENKLQDAREQYIDWLVEDAGDAYDWYVRDFGANQVRDLISNGELILDYEAIAQECISWDGRGNSLASYDGEEIELEDDLYAYRLN